MFRQGDQAFVRATGATVTIDGPAQGLSWPVRGEPGAEVEWYHEGALHMAHPSVLASISGRRPSEEAYFAGLKQRQPEAKRIDDNLLEDLRKALKSVKTVDIRGHWKQGVALRKGLKAEILQDAISCLAHVSDEDGVAILAARRSRKPSVRWVSLGRSIALLTASCPYCGVDSLKLETNGRVIRLVGDECPHPDGLPPLKFELNVPSGKLLIANDLRQWYPLPEGDSEYDVNLILGCRQLALAYADVGLAHAFVGSTYPGVYQLAGGRYKIANRPDRGHFEGEEVATIVTDLWWYSLCDLEEFERRIARFGGSIGDAMGTILEVPPGVYRFTHHDRGPEGPGEILHATFERARVPDPVRDYRVEYDTHVVCAHAYVQAQVKQWPTLYGGAADEESATPWDQMTEEQQTNCWQQVADHIYCVISGGTDWHEKGHPLARVDSSIPDTQPPKFRAQYHWYPYNEEHGGLFEPKVLSPSFARLAFEVLESIISFGMEARDGERCREVKEARKRMQLALKRYREMAAQYPGIADPEYVAWISDGDRADRWVQEFDLGPEITEKHAKHLEMQHWFPEGEAGYAVEIDSRLLADGHYAWHPRTPQVGGCWASKANAQRYAIPYWTDNEQEGEDNCFWSHHAGHTVPLYSVARVVKTGTVSHMGERILELEYDYGTEWMLDRTRKGVAEYRAKKALRPLTRVEYETTLPEAESYYMDAEAAVDRALKHDEGK